MITLLHPNAGRFPFCTELIAMQRNSALTSQNPKDFFHIEEFNPMKTAPSPIAPPALDAPRRSAATRRTTPHRRRIVSRLWHTAERQVEEIEQRLLAIKNDPMALEREAKTLAIIARIVRDLVAIDAETDGNAQKTRPDQTQPGNATRSIEAFRAELAQRLDALRDERAGEGAA